MTPTEQDKLRELVHIVQNADTTYDAIKFITADRKRVEVEAFDEGYEAGRREKPPKLVDAQALYEN